MSAIQDGGLNEPTRLHERERRERAYNSCVDVAAEVSKCKAAGAPEGETESVTILVSGKDYEWQGEYLWGVKTKMG